MAGRRSGQARRGQTGRRARSRTARRKVQVERHYQRRYAGVKGANTRPVRKAAATTTIRRKATLQRRAVTNKPRTYKRRITKPTTKAPPISAASYLSMF